MEWFVVILLIVLLWDKILALLLLLFIFGWIVSHLQEFMLICFAIVAPWMLCLWLESGQNRTR
jgi:hypothetical protein